MLSFVSFVSFISDTAAAIVGNSTPGTIAAGVVARGGRPPVAFQFSISEHGGPRSVKTFHGRDYRAAMREALKLAKGSPFLACGFDGPVVRFGPPEVYAGIVSAACYGPDGVECGHLTVTRADGDAIRSRRCAAAVAAKGGPR